MTTSTNTLNTLTHIIKSKLSPNYYTNFEVYTDHNIVPKPLTMSSLRTGAIVVTYNLIDARRDQVSRTYIFTEGEDVIGTLHTTKWEHLIKVNNLQNDLRTYLNELVQRERERLDAEVTLQRDFEELWNEIYSSSHILKKTPAKVITILEKDVPDYNQSYRDTKGLTSKNLSRRPEEPSYSAKLSKEFQLSKEQQAYNFMTLMMANLATFLIILLIGLNEWLEGDFTKGVMLMLVSCVPCLGSLVAYLCHHNFNK